MTVAEKLSNIERLATSGPQLLGSERAEYDLICARIHRAQGDVRRAQKRGDAQKTASAQRSLGNAEARRTEFLAPKVDRLWAPVRIISKGEGHWHGPSGSGVHRYECEMVLDYKDLSGPQYRTVRVLKDEGGPPTNARKPHDTMGVAWWAITGQIERGGIVVLDAGAS